MTTPSRSALDPRWRGRGALPMPTVRTASIPEREAVPRPPTLGRVEPSDPAVRSALLNDESSRTFGTDMHNHPPSGLEPWLAGARAHGPLSIRQLIADRVASSDPAIDEPIGTDSGI